MLTTELPSLAERARTLPPGGRARERQLQHLIDLQAASEAVAALRGAAERAGEQGVGRVLSAASTLLSPAAAEDPNALDRLREGIASSEFIAILPEWVDELRHVAASRPDTGACTVATALELWSLTGHALVNAPSAVLDELAETLSPLLAARLLAIDVAANAPALIDDGLRADLCHTYSARAAAAAGATCAELVFGHRSHLIWDAQGCASCYASDELDDLEAVMPGIASGAGLTVDVIEADGSHPAKEGPCARFDGLEGFMKLRHRLDGCLTGARIAKDRAVAAVARTLEEKA
jgi:hypothetical protein